MKAYTCKNSISVSSNILFSITFMHIHFKIFAVWYMVEHKGLVASNGLSSWKLLKSQTDTKP